jgi:hypothetical protein
MHIPIVCLMSESFIVQCMSTGPGTAAMADKSAGSWGEELPPQLEMNNPIAAIIVGRKNVGRKSRAEVHMAGRIVPRRRTGPA